MSKTYVVLLVCQSFSNAMG